MILTEANSQLAYQSALAATRTVRRSCQQRHLWQSPVLAGFLSVETSLAVTSAVRRSFHPRVGEGNENLVYSSPWDFNRSLTCRKILRHGNSSFTFHTREVVLRIFIVLKNPSPWPGSNLQPLRPVASKQVKGKYYLRILSNLNHVQGIQGYAAVTSCY
jgi:hypothetical protein